MRKIYILILACVIMLQCKGIGFSLMKNELKVADEIAKNKKEETNITGELNTNKKENNIESEKVEITETNKIDNKTENAVVKATATMENKAELKTDIQTDLTASASADLQIGKKETVNNTGENIQNISGLSGLDVIYLLIGISVAASLFFAVIGLIIGKFFLKSKKEVMLETKYAEKNLLKSAINQTKQNHPEYVAICDLIINQYDINKLLLSLD